MATIIKRNGSYRAQVTRKGIRKSATFDTKAEAERWAYLIEASIFNEQLSSNSSPSKNVVIESSLLSMIDVFERYKQTVSPLKRGFRWEKIRLESLSKDPFFQRPVSYLTNQHMAQWRDKRLLEVSASTVNRELNLISAVLTTALKEWGVELTANPVHAIKRPVNPKSRNRRVSREEQDIIVKQLGWDGCSEPTTASQWTAFAFFLAIETAMRRGELASIFWKDVYLERSYIHLEVTKNGEERNVPLSLKAKALLALLNPKGDDERVIPIAPDVITSLFRRAKLAAGLNDLRFHDSRREATTQLSKKLSNVLELSAVTGHKSLNMLKVYYEPNATELAKKLE